MQIKEYAPARGQIVDVYLNLRKPGFFSIRDAKTKKVIAYAQSVSLQNAVMTVSESGRRYTLEKEKMVHAWIRGSFQDADTAKPAAFARCINYKPERCGHFYDTATGEAVTAAAEIHMSARKVWTVGSGAEQPAEQTTLF